MELTVIVPTFNEAPNVAELVRRTAAALQGIHAEILFVDDSRDETPEAIRTAAAGSTVPVRMIHRDDPVGGLSGAVIEGLRASTAEHCVVMDGDLQHPPELIPELLAHLREDDVDTVVASRYCGEGGSADGLSGGVRRFVSTASTRLAKGLFPRRLQHCSDPMTGFFGFRRAAVQPARLRPTGFKILLEILARHRLRVVEIPFVFGERFAGQSKASFTEGTRFLRQLAALRFGLVAAFFARYLHHPRVVHGEVAATTADTAVDTTADAAAAAANRTLHPAQARLLDAPGTGTALAEGVV